MIQLVKESLWKQFGGSIDMLINAITAFPDQRWTANKKFFYMSYHVAIFLDYYLNVPAAPLSSPLPFTLKTEIPEDAIDDIIPNHIYTKVELLDYIQASRKKCEDLILTMSADDFNQEWVEIDGNKVMSVFELMLYNMRHVQHHAAQLNMLLRKETGDAPHWVRSAR